MVIGTALGWGNLATIALAVGLAYLFGFALTSLPLFRAGLAFGAIVPIALAADTVSITIMEVIDNAVRAARARRDGGRARRLAPLGGDRRRLRRRLPLRLPREPLPDRRGRGHAVVHEYHH